MKDIDGNIYKTVKINGLTWMAENLKVEKLNDGTELAIYTTIYDWLQEPQSSHIGAFGYFDNIANYKNQYGCLYDRKSVETGKLCPTGWHVPTKAEWESLFAYAGGNNATASAKLRTISGWLDNNNNEVAGTDALGFSAKAGGQFYAHLEEYDDLNHAAFWWASESYQALIRTDRILVSNELWNDRDTRSNGDYVRCVKD